MIGDDDWISITDYLVFDHKTPFKSFKPFIEEVKHRPEVAFRFIDGKVLDKWISRITPPIN